MEKPSLTEQLVIALDQRRPQLLEPATQTLSRYYLLDWLGSAIGGMATPTGKAFLRYGESAASGASSIPGLPEKRSAGVAALVNGALSHIVEMDDVERASIIHPGAVVIPAALAVADEVNAGADQLLAAIAAGYEVAIRIGSAVGARHYYHFHNTSTCGVFGAAIAAGWLYQLDHQQLVWALGNAGTQAAGLWEFNAEGAQSKPLHIGGAAANGVLAAKLAQGGISGARRILEGDRGFFAGLAPEGHPSRVVERLDGPFKIGDVSIKPHASCRHTHAPIDAALQVREQLLSRRGAVASGELTKITVSVYQAAQVLCDKSAPASVADAKFSLQYCVATALVRGQVGLEEFSDPQRQAPQLTQFMDKIEVVVDPVHEARYPDCWAATLCVVDSHGSRLEVEVANPKGDPENPLSQQELEQKFRLLCRYGLGASTETADQLIDWVAGLTGSQALDTALLTSLQATRDMP